ncbi:MAG TPA: hypothetical protein PKA64_12090 [Myxococcota bacterium]|nr:hypothetical protein [Myxococcota bacterium]
MMLIWLALAAPSDELLAPRLDTLEARMARTVELLDAARVFQEELAMAQSMFVAENCPQGACPPERAAQLIVDAQHAGHASRDLLQSARAELDRMLAIAEAPTVVPLLDDARREAIELIQQRTQGAVRAWLVRTAWYEERMKAWAVKLKARVDATCAREPATVLAEGGR